MSAPGSGKFVQVREWTCPEHNYPRDHVCDCHDCDREWDCDLCATAEYQPVDLAGRALRERERQAAHHQVGRVAGYRGGRVTFRLWTGAAYVLRDADTIEAALRTLKRDARALVTKIERVKSTERRKP